MNFIRTEYGIIGVSRFEQIAMNIDFIISIPYTSDNIICSDKLYNHSPDLTSRFIRAQLIYPQSCIF